MSHECMSLPPLVEYDPVEDVMEKVCSRCRFPFICRNEDELERECDACGIERDIRKLLGGKGNAGI